jgi:hypothetical protein
VPLRALEKSRWIDCLGKQPSPIASSLRHRSNAVLGRGETVVGRSIFIKRCLIDVWPLGDESETAGIGSPRC